MDNVSRRGAVAGLIGVGLVAGVVPFVLSMSSSTTTVVDGAVSMTYRDWVAIGGGGLAVLCAVLAIAYALRGKRLERAGLGAVVLVLGVAQLARGFGAFEPAPSSASSADEGTTTAASPIEADSKDPAKCPDQNACDNLEYALKDTDPPGAQIARMRSCELGQQYSCHKAGLVLQDGAAGIPADPTKAFELFLRACDLGNDDGCTDAGVAYFNGEGVTKDLERARTLLIKACDTGAVIACKNVAVIYEKGHGVPVDLTRTFEFAARSCGDGHYDLSVAESVATGCDMAGMLLLDGKATKADPARANGYFAQACDRSPFHCFNLGVSHEQGSGMKKDYKTARELYRKACDDDNVDACNNLGNLMNRGRGGPKDAAAAKALFKKACDGGMELGCKNLGA